jgi:hypothetical protein
LRLRGLSSLHHDQARPGIGGRLFPDSFNYEQLRSQLLDPLGPGGSLQCRTAVFDYRIDRLIDAPLLTAAPDAILLVDGVFLQVPQLAGAWAEVSAPRLIPRPR